MSLIETLKIWENILSSNSEKFLEFVGCKNSFMLYNYSWNSERLEYVYVTNDGEHVCDSIDISEWLKFLKIIRIIDSTGEGI